MVDSGEYWSVLTVGSRSILINGIFLKASRKAVSGKAGGASLIWVSPLQ